MMKSEFTFPGTMMSLANQLNQPLRVEICWTTNSQHLMHQCSFLNLVKTSRLDLNSLCFLACLQILVHHPVLSWCLLLALLAIHLLLVTHSALSILFVSFFFISFISSFSSSLFHFSLLFVDDQITESLVGCFMFLCFFRSLLTTCSHPCILLKGLTLHIFPSILVVCSFLFLSFFHLMSYVFVLTP